jgi:hypothetical protein
MKVIMQINQKAFKGFLNNNLYSNYLHNLTVINHFLMRERDSKICCSSTIQKHIQTSILRKPTTDYIIPNDSCYPTENILPTIRHLSTE